MSTLAYFLVWGAFFFFMMRFGCGAHIMGHSKSHRQEDGNTDAPNTIGMIEPLPTKNMEQNNEHQH